MKEGNLIEVCFKDYDSTTTMLDLVYLRRKADTNNNNNNNNNNNDIVFFDIILPNKDCNNLYISPLIMSLNFYKNRKKSQMLYTTIMQRIYEACDTHNGDIKVLEDIMMDKVHKILYEDEIKFYNNLIKTFTDLAKKGKKFLREFIFECYNISVIPTTDSFSRKCLDNLFEIINDFDKYNNSKEILMSNISKITEGIEKFGAEKHPTD